MADHGFEPYHVPQQSRRDKLRFSTSDHHNDTLHLQTCAGLLTCADLHNHPPPSSVSVLDHHTPNNQRSDFEKEGVNFMKSTTTTTQQVEYMDQQSSFQEINGNPFLYTPQNFRFFEQSFNGGVYKPEPLSVISAHHHEANNTSTTVQGLSLSLSSNNHTNKSTNSLLLELNLQRYEPSIVVSTSSDLSMSSCVPVGPPFNGYDSILKGSRFLKPAKQLLEQLCDVDLGIYNAETLAADSSSFMHNLLDAHNENVGFDDDPQTCRDGEDRKRKKSRLISLLDEVYRRYKQYYQQLQTVVASFESVAGLSDAAPFANLALKATSKHFRCLKNAITDQLQFTSKSNVQISCERDAVPRVENPGKGLYFQKPAIHNVGYANHQPVWRPQRGLPERAVIVLRAWLYDHFLHPYPTDTDKVMLAKQTGLSRSQVSNWFINARVRLWKPMVEEIHNLETMQASHKSTPQKEAQNNSNSSLTCKTPPSKSEHRIQDPSCKRARNVSSDQIAVYDTLSSSHSRRGGVESNNATAAGNGGVSLTLGLHQNNGGVGLSEPFPRNAARRFGIETNYEGFVMGGFEAHNRQLLHDFVG